MPRPAPVFFSAKRPLRRKRRSRPGTPAPALVLVSAAYVQAQSVTLTFDRAVDPACVGSVAAGQVEVLDGRDENYRLVGVGGPGGVTLVGPASVRIALAMATPIPGSEQVLVASAATGIVALGGGTWAGAEDVPLPFP